MHVAIRSVMVEDRHAKGMSIQDNFSTRPTDRPYFRLLRKSMSLSS